MRDHPAEEVYPAQRRCRRHPAREAACGVKEKCPRGEAGGQDPGQPEQRQRKTPQTASARQELPGRVQVVGVGVGRCDRGPELVLQDRDAVGQAGEAQPQADLHAALDLARLAFARQLLLQSARKRLAGLLVGQRPHVGVDLLGGLRHGRLGRRRGRRLLGLGRRELLRLDRPVRQQQRQQRQNKHELSCDAPVHKGSFRRCFRWPFSRFTQPGALYRAWLFSYPASRARP